MNDEEMEKQIQDKGLNGPRVTLDHVKGMMGRVFYRLEQPEGTTSTFAHAYLDNRFYLASGHTACVDPANFNTELGQEHAISKAGAAAQDKLYELEGYALYTEMADAAYA